MAKKVDDKIPMLTGSTTDESDLESTSPVTYGTSNVDAPRDPIPENMLSSDSDSSQAEFTAFDRSIRSTKDGSYNFIIILTIFSALGGFLFGYDTGVVSGAMIMLRRDFSLTTIWQELIVSITIAAAAIFAIIGGVSNTAIGRKKTVLISSVIFTVGSLVLAVAVDKSMLLIGRLTVGIAIGLSSMTIPMYIAESAPVSMRGRMVTMYNLFITSGQFAASIIDGAFSYTDNGWRYMLGLAAVPGLLMFAGFLWLPESPRWLVTKGYNKAARDVLIRIRGTPDVTRELENIIQNVEEDKVSQKNRGTGDILLQIFTTPTVRRAVVVGCLVQMFQQICGINTVMYYSATIIKMSGVRSDSAAIWLAALTAGINTTFSFVGLFLVDKIGRRPLLLGSLVGVCLSLVVLAVGFQIGAHQAPPVTTRPHLSMPSHCTTYSSCLSCTKDTSCGFCYAEATPGVYNRTSCLPQSHDAHASGGPCSNSSVGGSSDMVWDVGFCPSSVSWMTTLGLVLYLACFSPGMGPMPWTINSEIYPTWARSTCIAMATFTNWTFNLFIAMTFLTLTEVLTTYGAFWLYATFSAVGISVLAYILPETKGKSLEQVQELFTKPYC